MKKLKDITLYITKNFYDLFIFLYRFLYLHISNERCQYQSTFDRVVHLIGNGPSASESLPFKGKNQHRFCTVNWMVETDLFARIKPEYHVVIDPAFFNDTKKQRVSNFYKLLNLVEWKLTVIVQTEHKSLVRNLVGNKNISFIGVAINYLPAKGRFTYLLYKKNFATPKFQNVIASGIYAFIQLGFKEINLYGVEHDEMSRFTITSKNEVLLRTSHFYGEATSNLTKSGKVHPGEFWRFISNYSSMLKGYAELSGYAKHVGVNIVNCTEGSYIDSFLKRSL